MKRNVVLRVGCLAFLLLFASASFGSGNLFWPAKSYSTGGYAVTSVAVGDVNRDGKPDLVVALYCDNAGCDRGGVGVLLGNGDGTFQAVRIYDSGGTGAQSIAIGDVNRDGIADLLVANQFVSKDDHSGMAGVLLGNGDGTFQATQTNGTGGSWAAAIAAVDVNGDGNLDLLLANKCPSNVNCDNGVVGVLLGNGDGSFQTARTYSSGGYGAVAIAVADVNEDGRPDVAVANSSLFGDAFSGGAGVLLGNGDGTFQGAQTYTSGGWLAKGIVVADVNGDGKPDLLVGNEFGARNILPRGDAGVLLGNGDGTFEATGVFNSNGYQASAITVGDVNGDGIPDLLMANNCIRSRDCPSGGVGVVLSRQGQINPFDDDRYGSGGDGALSIAAGDVNGDGKPDVVVGNQAGGIGVLLTRHVQHATTTGLSSNLNPSIYGQAVTLTATVSSDSAGAPTGTVTFSDGTKWLGKATLSGGVATVTTKKLTVGTHSITATYNGDIDFLKSTSPAVMQVVTPASSALNQMVN